MEKEIYDDIATRTCGDIYIGVVGPVRCGKSMFITKFMQNLVIPNIKNKHMKQRAIDELPQSAEGKTIMTTQPNFVPNEAVEIALGNVEMKVRMVDCVGYLIGGVMGHEENQKARKVKTPWSTQNMLFEEAAELGTKKVIQEHSTIGIVITTDGSITDIPRENYVDAEKRIIAEIKKQNKPFVVLINSKHPADALTVALSNEIATKYGVVAMPVDVSKLDVEIVEEIFEKILLEFPVQSFKVKMPQWLQALPYQDPIIQEVITEIKKFGENVKKIGQIDKTNVAFLNSEDFEPVVLGKIKMGEGNVFFDVTPKQHLFYKVLSLQCGTEIKDDFALVSHIHQLAYAKSQYDKLENALKDVKETGYGVVSPKLEDMSLEDPQIVKQGARFGVKLKASAPSLHIMRVDVETEINPLVGTEQQSEDLVKYLMDEFQKNPSSIWETNMFGKSLHSLVGEGINSKIVMMPVEAQRKMRKTLGRIVNEGKGGIICILL
ncbi:MAG: stage IV sporulation protein A [Clostridia bacterium]